MAAASGDGFLVSAYDDRHAWSGNHSGAYVRSDGRIHGLLLNDKGIHLDNVMNATSESTAFVAAVSGKRQEIAFFAAGVDHVRIFDFDTHQERLQPIGHGDLLENPLAATYRQEEDEYVVLDNVSNKFARLYRYSKSTSFELAGEWEWTGTYSSYALTTSTDGDIVLSASNATTHKYAILSFDPYALSMQPTAPPRALHLWQIFGGDRSIVVPALMSQNGLVSALKDGSNNHVFAGVSRAEPQVEQPLSGLSACF